MNQEMIKNTIEVYKQNFGVAPEIVLTSPGRINIIGEHIDYNDGYVLPAAIDKIICFAIGKNYTNEVSINAIDFNETATFTITESIKKDELSWLNYILGVIQQLQSKEYSVNGFNCAFSSSIPIGAGLSSSAALECGLLFGLNQLFQYKIAPLDIALMGQQAEHWVGIKCGIMDQFASVFGKENQVIKIDCKTLEYQYYPADFKEYSLVLFDSNVQHSLATSEYNKRREECDEGLSKIHNKFPQITSFRDCKIENLKAIQNEISEVVFRRCKYVIEEIERVNMACTCLVEGNIATLGNLMYETHEGLSKLYEVSCPELELLVNLTKDEPAVLGARVMGGGFGGCTINLIKKGFEKTIIEKIKKEYQATFDIQLIVYNVNIENGTTLINKR